MTESRIKNLQFFSCMGMAPLPKQQNMTTNPNGLIFPPALALLISTSISSTAKWKRKKKRKKKNTNNRNKIIATKAKKKHKKTKGRTRTLKIKKAKKDLNQTPNNFFSSLPFPTSQRASHNATTTTTKKATPNTNNTKFSKPWSKHFFT